MKLQFGTKMTNASIFVIHVANVGVEIKSIETVIPNIIDCGHEKKKLKASEQILCYFNCAYSHLLVNLIIFRIPVIPSY